jgi:hypothetical protein
MRRCSWDPTECRGTCRAEPSRSAAATTEQQQQQQQQQERGGCARWVAPIARDQRALHSLFDAAHMCMGRWQGIMFDIVLIIEHPHCVHSSEQIRCCVCEVSVARMALGHRTCSVERQSS